MSKLTWETAESDLQTALGLNSTPGSGNQWNAPGDAVDNRHYSEAGVLFLADTKSTKAKSYRVDEAFLKEWTEKAVEMGKTFLLHIQFQNDQKREKSDWVLCSLVDFTEILSQPKSLEQNKAIKEIERLLSTFKDEDMREKYLSLFRLAVGV